MEEINTGTDTDIDTDIDKNTSVDIHMSNTWVKIDSELLIFFCLSNKFNGKFRLKIILLVIVLALFEIVFTNQSCVL